MADIELLKRLIEACDIEHCADEEERDRNLNEFYSVLEPEDVATLIAENEWLKLIEDGWNEWNAKTEWVQETAEPHELGKHRADALRGRIDQLKAELERARATADRAHACLYRWENGHAFNPHGAEREVQRELYEVIRPGALDGIAKLHAAMGNGGGQNGSKAAETRVSAGLEGGGHGGNSGGAE